uniref:Uncharacterized protein n=1 Tax=Cannabis sativa TaxID=3483 RepID=A0A803PYQ6_CANSA
MDEYQEFINPDLFPIDAKNLAHILRKKKSTTKNTRGREMVDNQGDGQCPEYPSPWLTYSHMSTWGIFTIKIKNYPSISLSLSKMRKQVLSDKKQINLEAKWGPMAQVDLRYEPSAQVDTLSTWAIFKQIF